MSKTRRIQLPRWPERPTVRGPGGRWLCRCGCGLEVQPPRRTWAAEECLERVRLNCDWSVVKDHVYELQKGTCQTCGCHPESLRAEAREALSQGNRTALTELLAAGWPRITRKWFEIDHIVPVSDGGAALGRKNLRVQCYRCHKLRSAEQTRQRRQKKSKRID